MMTGETSKEQDEDMKRTDELVKTETLKSGN